MLFVLQIHDYNVNRWLEIAKAAIAWPLATKPMFKHVHDRYSEVAKFLFLSYFTVCFCTLEK